MGLRLLQTLTDPQALRSMLGSAKRLQRLQAILQHTVMQVRADQAGRQLGGLVQTLLSADPPECKVPTSDACSQHTHARS